MSTKFFEVGELNRNHFLQLEKLSSEKDDLNIDNKGLKKDLETKKVETSQKIKVILTLKSAQEEV